MTQNDTTEDSETRIGHLRCSRCNDSVGIVKEDGQHYAICHCTNADGEIDRMELESLDALYPSRWVYV